MTKERPVPSHAPEAPASISDLGRPVRWAAWLLLPPDRREEFLGDVVEAATRAGRGHEAGRLALRELVGSAPALVALRIRRSARRAAPLPAPAMVGLALDGAAIERAFDAYLDRARGGRPRRRAPLALSFAAHGALLAFGVAASFWRVDELSPPVLTVTTFLPVPPPSLSPAPGGPARAEGPRPARPARKRPVQPSDARPNALVAPTTPAPQAPDEAPAEAPDEDDQADGPAGGGPATSGAGAGSDTGCPPGAVCAGPGGGTGTEPGNTPPDPVPPRPLPPQLAEKSCLDCPLPRLPPAFARAGGRRELLARICVDARGAVTKVGVLRGIDPAADPAVVEALRHWRYAPYQVNGLPVPFCYLSRFVFETR